MLFFIVYYIVLTILVVALFITGLEPLYCLAVYVYPTVLFAVYYFLSKRLAKQDNNIQDVLNMIQTVDKPVDLSIQNTISELDIHCNMRGYMHDSVEVDTIGKKGE